MIGRVLKQAVNSTIRCDCGNLFQRNHTLTRITGTYVKSFSTSRTLSENEGDKIQIETENVGFAERFKSSKATEKIIIESQKVLKSEEKAEQDGLHGFFDMGILIPTLDTFDALFDGVPYSELPIAYIQCTRNNTIISIMNHQNTKHLAQMSGGVCGFKNAAKSSSVAGQTAGYSIGQIARQQGLKHLRVVVKGFGQGRYAALQGIKLAGMNIVSITDSSIDHQIYRQRKVRRV